jgi:hypothetical protein
LKGYAKIEQIWHISEKLPKYSVSNGAMVTLQGRYGNAAATELLELLHESGGP